jgi:lipoprotein signal peptidase
MTRTKAPQWSVFAAVSAIVIGTDQATKWFAWRHLDGSLVNEGGYILLGPVIRSWFSHPSRGAVANIVGAVLVVAGAAVLLRRPRRRSVLIGGGLVAAGWASNLLDRFGLHRWSAPGSERGVVDFIPSGGTSRGNVADLWIVAGVLLLAAVLVRDVLARRRGSQRPPTSDA